MPLTGQTETSLALIKLPQIQPVFSLKKPIKVKRNEPFTQQISQAPFIRDQNQSHKIIGKIGRKKSNFFF